LGTVGVKIDMPGGSAVPGACSVTGSDRAGGFDRVALIAIATAPAMTTSTTATAAGPRRLAGLVGGGAGRRFFMDR